MSTHSFRLLLISNKASAGFNIAPPLGLYQLHAYVSQRGIYSVLCDRELEEPDAYLRRAEDGEFDVIGYSVSHDKMGEDLDLLWRFRAAAARSGREVIFIAGGQEAALNHAQWLTLGIDVCFLGFAERTLLEFCQRVADGGGTALGRLCAGLSGVAYRNAAGGIVYQPSALLTPQEFRDLFHRQIKTVDIPYHRYWSRLRAESADTTLGASTFIIENVRLYTTSHCPRRCGFCNSQSFLPQSQGAHLPITLLSAEEVCDLVMHMVRTYGARGFLFSDDDFPIGNKAGLDRLGGLCRMIVELKKNGDLAPETRFACQARIVDFLQRGADGTEVRPNTELMKTMVLAGFGSIGMGVETFSDRLLKAPSVNKIGIESRDCRIVIDAMLAAGLTPQMNLIIGIPEYTPDELADTISTSVDYLVHGCDIAVTKHLLALPGSPIYGTGLYTLRSRSWRHPLTGAEERIADHFIPNDPLIRSVGDRFDAESAGELARVTTENGWGGKIVHKRVVGMCALIAVAKLMLRRDLETRCRNILADIISNSPLTRPPQTRS